MARKAKAATATLTEKDRDRDDDNTPRYVAVVRVSSPKQKKSKLGLDAEVTTINHFLATYGGKLLNMHEEVRSGAKKFLRHRPVLQKALEECRDRGATLLVPRVDRLSRSTETYTDIKRTEIPIRLANRPDASQLEIDLHVAFAAEEARKIGENTKKALAEFKTKKKISKRILEKYEGNVPAEIIATHAGKLGTSIPDVKGGLNDEHRKKGGRTTAAKAKEEAMEYDKWRAPLLKRLRDSGLSLQQVADELNNEGLRTRRGKRWTPVQVRNILMRHYPPTSIVTHEAAS
jgi:DNA invertase Pin-like site-specific DNA recombinase